MVYMGDLELKSILFIGSELEAALSLGLDASPISAVLMNDEKTLIVGCEEGCIKMISLEHPDKPKVTHSTKLQKTVFSIIALSPDYIFCG